MDSFGLEAAAGQLMVGHNDDLVADSKVRDSLAMHISSGGPPS
jgi:hypothetical protein